MSQLKPNYSGVQAHYDLSDDFFFLFLDPLRVYSCAYFEPWDISLDSAQEAKLDLSLGKCDLHSGHTLLDIGCGWGACAQRAANNHNVDVIGLTLSKNQRQYASQSPTHAGSTDIRLQGWEEFDGKVDRIVSIGAFEHFRKKRYPAFFDKCFDVLPADGRMMLHTIVLPTLTELEERGVPVEHEPILFAKFIGKHIFPGGQLCTWVDIVNAAERAGFRCEHTQSLRLHYAKTLKAWSSRLMANREAAAAITSEATYDLYMKYMTGCAHFFSVGHLDVKQFVLVK